LFVFMRRIFIHVHWCQRKTSESFGSPWYVTDVCNLVLETEKRRRDVKRLLQLEVNGMKFLDIELWEIREEREREQSWR
jgi:hypothetical protein